MTYLLFFLGGLVVWLLFGYVWCRWFVDDEEDEYQECPYE